MTVASMAVAAQRVTMALIWARAAAELAQAEVATAMAVAMAAIGAGARMEV